MSAILALEELLVNDPSCERIDLRGHELTTVDAELAFMHEHFSHLRHLDLSQNRLVTLPGGFGELLPRLVALDVSRNPFRSITELGQVLVKCPALRSLSVTFSSKADEMILLVMLPRLRILNAKPLEASGDSSPEAREKTSGGLALDIPSPSNASSPRSAWLDTPASTRASSIGSPQEKRDVIVQFAQVRRNLQGPIATEQATSAQTAEDTSEAPRAATQRPKPPSPQRTKSAIVTERKQLSVRPTELPTMITDEKTDWRKLLKKAQQDRAQGTAPEKPPQTKEFVSELKSIVKAFYHAEQAMARQVPKKTPQKSTHPLSIQAVDQHLESLSADLGELESQTSTDRSGIDVLRSRWKMLEVGTSYGIETATSVHASLGSGFAKLATAQKAIVEGLLKKAGEILNSQGRWRDRHSEQGHVSADEHKAQMKILLDVAETLERDLEGLQQRYRDEVSVRERVELENQTLQNACAALQRKIQSGDTQTKMQDKESSPQPPASGHNPRRIRKREAVQTSIDLSTRRSSPKDKRAPPSPSTAPIRPFDMIRSLTIRQLVDFIHCIWASKMKYDARTKAIGAPPETMEQHMYTYLNQRFGLQALTIEYASAIWKGCQVYTRQDSDVAIFHALLLNRLDEGFLVVKKKLQHAIRELLRAYFHARYPLKSESAIKAFVTSRLEGSILEPEWTELLLYLYDPGDSSILLRLMKRKAEAYQRQRQEFKSSGAMPKGPPASRDSGVVSVPFAVFEKLLLDYQLQGRLKLLEAFHEDFARHDSAHVGVITRQQFCELVDGMAPTRTRNEVSKMLARIDPFDHDTITFSDATSCLLTDIRQQKSTSGAAQGT